MSFCFKSFSRRWLAVSCGGDGAGNGVMLLAARELVRVKRIECLSLLYAVRCVFIEYGVTLCAGEKTSKNGGF